jgi:hypothetical protein
VAVPKAFIFVDFLRHVAGVARTSLSIVFNEKFSALIFQSILGVFLHPFRINLITRIPAAPTAQTSYFLPLTSNFP